MKSIFKKIPFLSIFLIFLTLFLSGLLGPNFTKPIISPTSLSTPEKNKDFFLIIPSLSIQTPIITDVDGTNKNAYNKALESGVAQLLGSSKPGEGSNIFIFGHSSYYFWAPGNYKEIFKNLEKLKENDEIIIWYKQKEHKYKVAQKKIVWPNEVDVALPTKTEQVSLMTCVPPGTTYKRLIVTALPN